MRFRVFRKEGGDADPRYDVFEFEAKKGMTVLGALFHIQDRFDRTLTFRYSCRGAVCGSCAMLINKLPRLACRTQISGLIAGGSELKIKDYTALHDGPELEPGEVLIEPLPHLPVIRDLVVDMTDFFDKYRKVEPVFKAKDPEPEKERRMGPKDVSELESYTNCILCACCYGSCPVDGKDPGYIGPAALAKLFRFHIDPREPRDDSRLHLANHPAGWWGCEFHTNCKRVCPKDVPPNLAIGKARAALKKAGKVPPGIEGK